MKKHRKTDKIQRTDRYKLDGRKICIAVILAVFCAIFVGEAVIAHLENYDIVKYATVELEVLDEANENGQVLSEVWITGIQPEKLISLEDIINNATENNGFAIGTNGNGDEVVVNTAGTEGRIVFEVPMRPETCITFWRQYLSGVVSISVEGKEPQKLMLYDETSAQNESFYFFEDDTLLQCAYIAAYALIYLFIALLCFALILLAFRIGASPEWRVRATKKYQFILFALFVIGIAVYCELVYPYLPDMESEIGDTTWYWRAGDSLIVNGKVSFENYANNNVTTRGYLIPLVCLLSRFISIGLFHNEYSAWFIISALMCSAFIVYIMPGFYEEIHKERPYVYQIIIFGGFLFFFWRGYLPYASSDFPATISLFGFILFVIKWIRYGFKRYAVIVGVFGYAAVNCRTSMSIVVYGVLLIVCVLAFVEHFSDSKMVHSIITKLRFNNCIKLFNNITCKSIVILLVAFVLIGLPQAAVNRYYGVWSLAPFDMDGAWFWSEDYKFSECAMNLSFFHEQTHPHWLQNKEGIMILQSLYPNIEEAFNGKVLGLLELIYLYAARLGDLLAYSVGKLFFMINIKAPIYNPPKGLCSGFDNVVFTFANYFLWIAFASALLNKNSRKKYIFKTERIIILCIVLLSVVPQLVMFVEWRYFLPLYMMCYYVFSFLLFRSNENGYKTDTCSLEGECFFTIQRTLLIVAGVLVLYSISEAAYANLYNYYDYTYNYNLSH